jgi:hypothetical protein
MKKKKGIINKTGKHVLHNVVHKITKSVLRSSKIGIMKYRLVLVSHVKLLNVSGGVYRMNGEVHLWAYINQVLLCINMAENQNCQITLRGSFLY